MSGERTPAIQFATLSQQFETAELGMWVFLATEVLFFGALFAAELSYRTLYPAAFLAAARHTELVIGSVNTALLLTSSATMVTATFMAKARRRRATCLLLGATALLGIAFLGLKGLEYAKEFDEHLVPGRLWAWDSETGPAGQLFYLLYYIITGVHAIHLTIGIALVLYLVIRTRQPRYLDFNYTTIEVIALYWSFVDVVWIFVFPVIYLGRG